MNCTEAYPRCNFAQPLVLLRDEIGFADVDEVDDWFGGDQRQLLVNDLNLVGGMSFGIILCFDQSLRQRMQLRRALDKMFGGLRRQR